MNSVTQESNPDQDEVVINYRDVGWSVRQSYLHLKKEGQLLSERKLYRSGALNEHEPKELHYLLETHGIQTVIRLSSDMNCKSLLKDERVMRCIRTTKESKPSDFPAHSSLIEVQLGGGRFKRKGVWMPATNETKIQAAKDAIHGHLKQVKQRFSKEVLNRKGLGGMYIDYAETSAKALNEIFQILSDPERLPVLIHCEQGKDRTGVVIAIILALCGVDRQVILDDYNKSHEGLYTKYEDVKDEMNDLGLKDEFAHTEPEALQEMFDYLEETYGSVDNFLTFKCQLTSTVSEKLRANLLSVQE